jgi:hypothetical protein
MVTRIEYITEFVQEQKVLVDSNRTDQLIVPVEQVYEVQNIALEKIVGITKPW